MTVQQIADQYKKASLKARRTPGKCVKIHAGSYFLWDGETLWNIYQAIENQGQPWIAVDYAAPRSTYTDFFDTKTQVIASL